MEIVDFNIYLSYLLPVVCSAGVIIGFINYNGLNTLHKTLLGYLSLMLFTDLLSRVIEFFIGNNLIIMHIYSFTELAFMLYFYKKHMLRTCQLPITLMGYAALLYILAEFLLIFVFRGLDIKQFQPYAKVADNFVVILLTLAYFNERMARFREYEWGTFVLNIVFLTIFTLNTLVFLPFNFLINEAGNIKFYFWIGHIIVLIVFYLYLTIELWRNGRTQML